MKKYKLTTQDLTTYFGYQWKIGENKTTNGNGRLCGPGFLHYYHHPLLAMILNPIHADIRTPRLFEVKATGKHLNDVGLKGGCTKMKLIRELPLPTITRNQKLAFGILCAKKVNNDPIWDDWSNVWLNRIDMTTAAATAVAASYSSHTHIADKLSNVVVIDALFETSKELFDVHISCCIASAAKQYKRYHRKNINLIKLINKAMKY